MAYDFQVVKLFGQYPQTKVENTGLEVKLATSPIGASVPIGLGKLLASFARTTKGQTAVADVKRGTISIGHDCFLSKRTDLFAVIVSDKVSSLDRGNGFVLGMRHNF